VLCRNQSGSKLHLGLGQRLKHHPVAVGSDQHSPPDRGRVHRLVVAVHLYVVVRRQPQHVLPAGGTGGTASIAALSASIRSSGRQPSTRWTRPLARAKERGELGVEVGRRDEEAARQTGAFQIVVEPFQQRCGWLRTRPTRRSSRRGVSRCMVSPGLISRSSMNTRVVRHGGATPFVFRQSKCR
jgi:hypothetical protein